MTFDRPNSQELRFIGGDFDFFSSGQTRGSLLLPVYDDATGELFFLDEFQHALVRVNTWARFGSPAPRP